MFQCKEVTVNKAKGKFTKITMSNLKLTKRVKDLGLSKCQYQI